MYVSKKAVWSTEDPADGTGRARVDQCGSYVMSIMAHRPVNGGEFEAARPVNKLVKQTVGEIDGREGEIGIKDQDQTIGRERHEIGRSSSKQTKAKPSRDQFYSEHREQVKIGTCVGSAVTFDRRDLRSFRGYCRGYDPR